jgi:hypothetical protein
MCCDLTISTGMGPQKLPESYELIYFNHKGTAASCPLVQGTWSALEDRLVISFFGCSHLLATSVRCDISIPFLQLLVGVSKPYSALAAVCMVNICHVMSNCRHHTCQYWCSKWYILTLLKLHCFWKRESCIAARLPGLICRWHCCLKCR